MNEYKKDQYSISNLQKKKKNKKTILKTALCDSAATTTQTRAEAKQAELE